MGFIAKLSFKDETLLRLQSAILDATSALLMEKGFDVMTMDDVAQAVGISKPSLYKHFKSKDALVAAALVRLMDASLAHLNQLDDGLSPLMQLQSLLRWAFEVRLSGGMPFLPSTNPQVKAMLLKQVTYVMKFMQLNHRLGQLVNKAQAQGLLNPHLPAKVILFSYYARTCDPAIDYLKQYSDLSDTAIVDAMMLVAFDGLRAQNLAVEL
jgi:AcrR family transcriptional regulator